MTLSNIDQLSEGSYFSLLYDMIKQRENPWLYAGTGYERIHNGGGDGNPTFGYGFNLAAFSASVVEQVIEHAYNGSMTAQQNDGLDLIIDWKTGASVNVNGQYTTLSRSDIINMAEVGLNGSPGAFGSVSQRAAIQSLSLNDAQASRMLDVMIKGDINLVHIEGPSGSFGYEDGLDYRLAEEGAPAYSTERAALLSVYYNAPVLIGPGVQNAILTDDRAQLWYEIRYNHNHTSHNGLQSRRAEEADLIGLVSHSAENNPAANIDEYAAALDTLFNGYDRLGRRILTRIEDRDGIDNFETAIAPELQELLDYFVLQPLGATSAPSIDYVQADTLGVSEQIDAGSFAESGVANGKTIADTVNLILGGAGDDLIKGLGAADYLYGGDGDDTIYGDGPGTSLQDAGHDFIDGGAGKDLLIGGQYDDFIRGGTENDDLRGSGGHDVLYGDKGRDYLRGNSGNDDLRGGAGGDTLDGGLDNDQLRGASGFDIINGRLGNDLLSGGTGKDLLGGQEDTDTLFGGDGDDTLFGNQGDDELSGGEGNDDIRGGNDDDTIAGDGGNDTLRGNSGDDQFNFAHGDDEDQIIGFVAGAATEDVISLSGFGAAFDTFAEVLAAASDDGSGNTVIDFGGGDTITLSGVASASLHQDDFIFG